MAAVAHDTGEITWETDEAALDKAIQNDMELQEIASKFKSEVSIEPDTDLNVEPTDSIPRDSDSASNSSSLKDSDDNAGDSKDKTQKTKRTTKNGDVQKSKKDKSSSKETDQRTQKQLKSEAKDSKIKKDEDKSKSQLDTDSLKSKKGMSSTQKKNPLAMLKKLTKSDKSSKESSFRSEFTKVVVDRLPQVFVAKYLGHREVTGVSGLHHVRQPVDDMIQKIRTKLDAKEQLELPFLYVIVSPKGIDVREHPSNKVKDVAPIGVMPIDFISYGVQDIKYWRVFTCIVVRTLSWQTRTATCHAFLCDSSNNGRKMAVSLGAAFSVYAKKLKSDGKSHNFQVELRPPDELTEELVECEA